MALATRAVVFRDCRCLDCSRLSSLFVLIVAAGVLVLPRLLACVYRYNGSGDQSGVALLVLASISVPIVGSPFLQAKNVFTRLLAPELEADITIRIGSWLLTPNLSFEESVPPEAPQYSKRAYWAAYGEESDTAETKPPDSMPSVRLSNRSAAVFYLHPTTWYTGSSWNAPARHPVTSYLSDDAIIPQQASAFNSAAAIYAPRYRQMSAAGYVQNGSVSHLDSEGALNLAYADVRAAFVHFLNITRSRRSLILAGHSQGSALGMRLLREFFACGEQRCAELCKRLVAAYLIGWTIYASELEGYVGACTTPTQTACVASWRTYARGLGDPLAFLYVPPPADNATEVPVCVNPLSWRTDEAHVGALANLGGLELMHYRTMYRYLIGYTTPGSRAAPPRLTPRIADAQCKGGALWTEEPASIGHGWTLHNAWTFAMMPGRNLHAYDYNLYFENIRANANERVQAHHRQQQQLNA